ncbi:amidohydrolase family protein [Frankia sp. CNm7]|uniref:Amidohydrolase family protein n=1 Tax=Frankia nepalensis TaxID=1836974 RepID=A0A937RCW1_9ACTN|nr:amidohydrolase family protein [Frankia nepalensis]MBL7510327.1 amidohydrolase family protein [Frankia nepalensis]MBL7517914.1 amidohydrolase family protein [Frankia nepalensis]MBL7626665.1 amidohydrolase family protein [Frankia nepalensis]
MLDLIVRGGRLIDGTGAPARTADVGVRDGRIVAVGAPGSVAAPAGGRTRVVDATGLVVCPGFIDVHTHYDAQLWWDPYATPSSQHGVTTVLGGNCGFTLAPLRPASPAGGPDEADYLRRMMAKVEGMPLEALESGVAWGWESFAEYLDGLDGRTAVNAGFLVGHCALRRYVMGPAAVGAAADDEAVAAMTAGLHAALEAGALGFSTTLSGTHSDGDGKPVASRWAGTEELMALARAVGDHEGTLLEGIVPGCLNMFSDDEIELLAALSAAAGRPLNWNVLTIDAAAPDRVPRQLAASRRARELGGRVIALTMPTLVPMNMSLGTFCALHLIPGWGEVMGLPVGARIDALRDSGTRARLLAAANAPEAGVMRRLANFGRYVIGDTYSPANEGLSGRVVEDIAAERGQDPFATLVEIAAADELRTVLWPMPTDNNPESWALRAETWQEPDVLLGGSDAGAHLDRMAGAPYPTRFLGDCLRGRGLVGLERAVAMMTGEPAAAFGLRGRGVIAVDNAADLVLFDPETVDSQPARLVRDLPAEAARLTAGSVGIAAVFVNGVQIVADGEPTGATPGALLRSGRDTVTVPTR